MKCLVVLAVLMAACGSTAAIPPRPVVSPRSLASVPCPDCMEYSPPAFYLVWWNQVEQCSGYVGKMSAVHFQVAPQPFLKEPNEPGTFLGMYFPEWNLIVFGHFWEADPPTVRHEMLHALIDQNGDRPDSGGHPTAEFTDKCRDLVRQSAPTR